MTEPCAVQLMQRPSAKRNAGMASSSRSTSSTRRDVRCARHSRHTGVRSLSTSATVTISGFEPRTSPVPPRPPVEQPVDEPSDHGFRTIPDIESTSVGSPQARQRSLLRFTGTWRATWLRYDSIASTASPDFREMQRAHRGRSMISTAMRAAFAGIPRTSLRQSSGFIGTGWWIDVQAERRARASAAVT